MYGQFTGWFGVFLFTTKKKDTWFLIRMYSCNIYDTYRCYCYFLSFHLVPFGHLACLHTIERNTTSGGILPKFCLYVAHRIFIGYSAAGLFCSIVCIGMPQSFDIEIFTSDFITWKFSKDAHWFAISHSNCSLNWC